MGPVFLCFHTESGAEEPLAAFSLHVLFQEVLPVFRAVAAFGGVYDVVRLDQNLIIDAVNIRVGMVVAHQISHPVHLLRRQARIRQKAPYQGAALFFLLLFVASLTSTISLTEVVIAYLVEELDMSRGKATVLNAAGVIIMASLASLSFGPLRDFTICGLTFFNLLDFLSSNIFMPLGGMLICIYAGWVLRRKVLASQLSSGEKHPAWLVRAVIFLLRYVAPPAIFAIFLGGLL